MIERLYVHNFRCLENFTLDFTDMPTAVLIGRNGAGKSTVLHALEVLRKIGRGASRVPDVLSAGDFPWHRKDLPMRFEIGMNLEGKRFEYSVAFEWPPNFHEARISEEWLRRDGELVFDRKGSEVLLAGGANFGLDWHVFALPVIDERPPGNSIREVRAFLARLLLLAPIPQSIAGFSTEPTSALDIHAIGFASALRALLQRKPKAYTELDAFLRAVVHDFSSFESEDRGKEGGSQLLFSFEQPETRKTFRLNFDGLSDGEKCFFLAAYVVAANAVGPPVVCFWDEPDSHLSLSEVGHFIANLRRMSNWNGQFIATTHHPETIRKFADENTFVLTRKSHLEPTVVRPLSAYAYNGDLIHALVRDEIVG